MKVDSLKLLILWSGRPGSNRRRPAWEAGILPLNYSRLLKHSRPNHYAIPPSARARLQLTRNQLDQLHKYSLDSRYGGAA